MKKEINLEQIKDQNGMVIGHVWEEYDKSEGWRWWGYDSNLQGFGAVGAESREDAIESLKEIHEQVLFYKIKQLNTEISTILKFHIDKDNKSILLSFAEKINKKLKANK